MSDNPFSDEPGADAAKLNNPFAETPAAAEISPGDSKYRRRPAGLTAVCILAIVLGVLGLGSSLFKGVNLVFATTIQGMYAQRPPGGSDNEIENLQWEMQKRQLQSQQKYALPMGIFAAIQFPLAAALLAGGILALTWKPFGRSMLLAACAVSIFYEIGSAAATFISQMDQMAVIDQMLPRIAEAAGAQQGGPPGLQMQNTIISMTRMAMYFGLGFVIVWTLAKLAYFVIAFRYLRRSDIQEQFQST